MKAGLISCVHKCVLFLVKDSRLKIKFLPHRRHTSCPLQIPTIHVPFIVRLIQNKLSGQNVEWCHVETEGTRNLAMYFTGLEINGATFVLLQIATL
jgi:hypothetical protein